jgi:ATP-dependent protease Clp ATPase subunit
MITKPRVFICGECVHGFIEHLKNPAYGETTQLFEECSFCSFMKSEDLKDLRENNEFKKGTRLVRRNTFCICDECLDFCEEILADDDTA